MQNRNQGRFSRLGLAGVGALGALALIGLGAMTTAAPKSVGGSLSGSLIVTADNSDAQAIDATIKRLYASISGPKGAARDFDTLRAVHTDDARMTVVRPNGAGPVVMSVDDYIARAGEMLVNSGFHENEIHRETDIFGNIAHVFSTYASTHEDDAGQQVPYFRGINSIQLVKVGGEWKVFSILWDNETPESKIPAQYDERVDDDHDDESHEHADHDDDDDEHEDDDDTR